MNQEPTPADGAGMRGVRAYTWWSLVLMSLVCLFPPLSDFTSGDFGHRSTAILLAAALITFVLRTRFADQAMRKPRRETVGAEHVAGIALVMLAWAYAVYDHPRPNWWLLLPALLGGAVVLNLPTAARWRVALGLTVLTGVIGGVTATLRPGSALNPWLIAGLSAFSVALFVLVDVIQLWFWDVVAAADHARVTAAELAVARERLRFAADLHDVQGHHLQAIVLKGQLAERLIGRDDDAARKHAAELTELAREALTDTRRVVQGYRYTNLGTEITNAVEILRSAGIRTEVHGNAALIPPPLQQLFGALVREGTTNVLRHSNAHHCEFTIDLDDGNARVRIINDGATAARPGNGGGITSLRERFATLHGNVRAEAGEDGRFELAGSAVVPGGSAA
jgi:two-component system sensor histidine kinase DesK